MDIAWSPGELPFHADVVPANEPVRDLVRHRLSSSHPPRQRSIGHGTRRDDCRPHSAWNEDSTPMLWVKTADQILANAVVS